MSLGLTLSATRPRFPTWPGFDAPTIIPPGAPALAKPLAYPSVAALCRALHRRRAGRGLRLARTVLTYLNSQTMWGFEVYWRDEPDTEAYAFTACGVGADLAAFQAAITANDPDNHA